MKDIKEYIIPHIKSVSLIDKVRVVNALIGFSRISPVCNIINLGVIVLGWFFPINEVE